MARAFALGAILVLQAACIGSDGRPEGPIIVIVTDGGAPANDAASGTKKLAEDCTSDADCESDHCFRGTKFSFCTLVCSPTTGATICAPPAFDGTCNNQGFCRRPD